MTDDTKARDEERGSVKLCGYGCVGHTTDEHAALPAREPVTEDELEDFIYGGSRPMSLAAAILSQFDVTKKEQE